jgi:hypothetical protein
MKRYSWRIFHINDSNVDNILLDMIDYDDVNRFPLFNTIKNNHDICQKVAKFLNLDFNLIINGQALM